MLLLTSFRLLWHIILRCLYLLFLVFFFFFFFFFQAEDGIRDADVTGVQTCALPICRHPSLDESWIILNSDADPSIDSDSEQPRGCILHGFEKATTPADFRMAVDENRAADVLRRRAVFAGDVIRVAPGTIHAICAGVVLLEIQEPSDTTYRVYDYQRPGMDGNPRELHLEKAMHVSNFGEHAPATLTSTPSEAHPAVRVLVDVAAYRIEAAHGITELEWTVDARTPQIVFVTSRDGIELSCGDESITLEFAQTAVLPAGVGAVRVSAAKPADIIVSGIGGAALVMD